jgi:hypothetical protein
MKSSLRLRNLSKGQFASTIEGKKCFACAVFVFKQGQATPAVFIAL